MSRRPALKNFHHTCVFLCVLCALTSAISVLVFCFSNDSIFNHFHTLFYLERMRGVRSRSISFVINLLRTLLPDGALTSPFSSITCALFSMQWRVGGILSGSVAIHSFTPVCLLLFSTSYELPNLQALCFDSVPTVGWVCRGAVRGSPKALLQLPTLVLFTPSFGRCQRVRGFSCLSLTANGERQTAYPEPGRIVPSLTFQLWLVGRVELRGSIRGSGGRRRCRRRRR